LRALTALFKGIPDPGQRLPDRRLGAHSGAVVLLQAELAPLAFDRLIGLGLEQIAPLNGQDRRQNDSEQKDQPDHCDLYEPAYTFSWVFHSATPFAYEDKRDNCVRLTEVFGHK
jgi:hypothetical protein